MKKVFNEFTIALLLLTAITGVMFISCNDDEEEEIQDINCKLSYFSDCDYTTASVKSEEAFVYSIDKHTLNIERSEQFNCAIESIQQEISLESGLLKITELPINPNYPAEANCVCIRNYKYSVKNVPSGDYKVEVSLNDNIVKIFNIKIN